MEISLRRRHALKVGDGAFSHKIGHLNRITGLRITAILLNGWILPIGVASAVEGLLSTGPSPSSFSTVADLGRHVCSCLLISKVSHSS